MSFTRPKSVLSADAYDRADAFYGRRWHAIQTLPRPLRSSRVVGYRGTVSRLWRQQN